MNEQLNDQRPLNRALLSVFDKTGLVELAEALHAAGTEIVSTGSTAQAIREAGLPVTEVESVTGFPEILDGRVKTLHPAIHGGLLADRTKPSHEAALAEHGIAPFDLVVVNLYPFEDTVIAGGSVEEIIEKIDIGGPAMVRSAAKNFATCAVVVEPEFYGVAAAAAARGGFTREERLALSALAFSRIAAYDDAIDEWMVELAGAAIENLEQSYAEVLEEAVQAAAKADEARLDPEEVESLKELEHLNDLYESDRGAFEAAINEMAFDMGEEERAEAGISYLRYGENAHQRAYVQLIDDEPGTLAAAELLSGKPMSYNNYVDADAALRAVYDHAAPCVAIIKHNNPCGIAVATEAEGIAAAYAKAHATDPVSAFGGVIAANRPVSLEMARQVTEVFTEVIVAPGYEEGAIEALSAKKNLRILEISGAPRPFEVREQRQIWGGLLEQEIDRFQSEGDDPSTWELVAGEAVDAGTLADLAFAWRAVRAPKSNAILLARDGAAVGIGMGQVNRVDSCTLAIERANTLGAVATNGAAVVPERARGSVAASDAFFPFADGPRLLIEAGVRAIVQPGGSVRDEDVIAACREAGVSMYVTGTRHFSH